jgi:DNA-binding XRE family transcriptional regulator
VTIIELQTPAEIISLLSRRAREARLAANLTQAELAGRAGISLGAVRKLESGGQTTLPTFVRCVVALGEVRSLGSVLERPAPASIAEMARQAGARPRRRARPQARQ